MSVNEVKPIVRSTLNTTSNLVGDNQGSSTPVISPVSPNAVNNFGLGANYNFNYQHNNLSHGSKVNRGFIYNMETKVKTEFQYNPETLQYSRGVSYNDISAPGIPYPLTQFGQGNIRSFNVELFFYDKPYTQLINQKMIEIGKFLTPETNVKGYKRPPIMMFVFGYFIRQCVLENLDILIEEFDYDGNPTMARFTLQLRQVGV